MGGLLALALLLQQSYGEHCGPVRERGCQGLTQGVDPHIRLADQGATRDCDHGLTGPVVRREVVEEGGNDS